jgi:small subunit ribosomal protein S14
MIGVLKNVNNIYNRINYMMTQSDYRLKKSLSNDSSLPKFITFYNNLNLSDRISLRNSKITTIKNRCVFSGNSRSVSRKFKMSRMVLKCLIVHSSILGVHKYSW